jgi:hypothetical protein
MSAARLQSFRGRRYFIFADTTGEGLPLLSTNRAYRPTIYRNPFDSKQSASSRIRRDVQRAAAELAVRS